MDEDTVVKKGNPNAAGLPDGVHVQLTFVSGPDRGMVKRLWKETTVLGRSEGEIKVEDPSASKRHLEIKYKDGGLMLRDLESTNGTLLNGARVREAALKNLDEITIGETVIQVTILEEHVEETPLDEVVVKPNTETETTHPRAALVSDDPLDGPLPGEVKSSLQVAQGPDAGLHFEMVKKATVIGRAGADLVLHDIDVSRKHASIEFVSKDRVIIKDLRSKNGTRVNQERVSVATLKNGDLIQVGKTRISFFVAFVNKD